MSLNEARPTGIGIVQGQLKSDVGLLLLWDSNLYK